MSEGATEQNALRLYLPVCLEEKSQTMQYSHENSWVFVLLLLLFLNLWMAW